MSRALADTVPRFLADEVRQLEMERLDALFVVMYPRAIDGDRLCVDPCFAIMERRARSADSMPRCGFSRWS